MEPLVMVILIIAGLGAIVVGIAGLAVGAVFWYVAIPLVCMMIGGPIGLCFGIGLVVIIGLIICVIQNN